MPQHWKEGKYRFHAAAVGKGDGKQKPTLG